MSPESESPPSPLPSQEVEEQLPQEQQPQLPQEPQEEEAQPSSPTTTTTTTTNTTPTASISTPSTPKPPLFATSTFIPCDNSKQSVHIENGVFRNARYPDSLVHLIDANAPTTFAAFKASCEKYRDRPCLGRRSMIAQPQSPSSQSANASSSATTTAPTTTAPTTTATTPPPTTTTKMVAGPYEWLTFQQVFDRANHFVCGMVKLDRKSVV